MRVVFVSNSLNHHSIPLCEKLVSLCDEFHFIATEKEYNQGYQVSSEADYLIDYSTHKEKCEKLVLWADAVIFGACPNSLIDLRMRENKLSFLYSERFFKKGTWRRFIPKTRNKIYERILKHKDKNFYVLSAGGFLPYDLSLLGYSKDKCYKWGYFPNTDIHTQNTRKSGNSILWSGRMLQWKHAEIAVKVASKLKNNGYRFTLKIVGEGPEKQNIERLVVSKKLTDCVKVLPSMPHEELLLEMAKSQIFMFTSDRYEGWGAVLNEAMANGCACVVSDAIGSAPYLIKENVNGLTFKSGNVNDAYKKVKYLLDEKGKTRKIGNNAKSCIENLWNYDIAAERFIELVNDLLNGGKGEPFKEGPCSKHLQ